MNGNGAVLWDLDGTLVDSEEYHWQAWRDTMAAEGVVITREQFLATFGWRNDAIVPRWLGADAPAERIARIGEAKEIRYRSLVRSGGLEPMAAAERWVRQPAREGWRQAVASSAPRENIDVVLEAIGLAGCFQAVVSAEDVRRGKPDPEVFLAAAARVGAPPEDCIVVEDAAAGIEAARRAGMCSVNVKSTPLDTLPPDAFRRGCAT